MFEIGMNLGLDLGSYAVNVVNMLLSLIFG